ncbi:protease inhibitor I42 family protein [Ktedonospora formicarum]|uniref:Uncharacterized protein n=1 Tax=Ktedonospora formicarum TaxID=2778364 RepID=A0A8J3MT04_9CHLR|nr:protease inhibitor I42 family protein [Ktedonospora formicarum]GHO43865.1 hypothetical protein KSX_20280 [Ktedonospora formicarum]
MSTHPKGKRHYAVVAKSSEQQPHIRDRKPFFMTILLMFALLLFLSACGAGGTSSDGTGSSGAGDGVTKTVKGFGAEHGCPTDTVLEKRSTNPAVTIKQAQQHSTVSAKKGDVIEIQLPFGSRWTGPTKSQGPLQLDLTPGIADQSANVCVWRFTAQGTGTTNLEFAKRALCNTKGQSCAMYVMRYDFTINIK